MDIQSYFIYLVYRHFNFVKRKIATIKKKEKNKNQQSIITFFCHDSSKIVVVMQLFSKAGKKT